MNKYGEVALIATSYQKDSIGQLIPSSSTERTIQCTVGSVTRSEWLTAHQGGYEAHAMLKVFSAAYDGESKARYGGKVYDVYRTYQDGDDTEIYLGTRIGDLDASQ